MKASECEFICLGHIRAADAAAAAGAPFGADDDDDASLLHPHPSASARTAGGRRRRVGFETCGIVWRTTDGPKAT